MTNALDDLAGMGGWIAGAVAANEALADSDGKISPLGVIVQEAVRWLHETEEGRRINSMSLLEFARYCGASCDENDPDNDYVWWGRHGI